MMRLFFCAVLGLAVAVGGLNAAPKKDKKAPKDAGKEIAGKVVKVDQAKSTVTITTKDGKTLTFSITKDTLLSGPRGGKVRKGLKDDRFSAGSDLKIVPGADGKSAKSIKLGYRKRKSKAPKDKTTKEKVKKDKK